VAPSKGNVVVEPVAAVAAPAAGFCSICEAIVGFVEGYLEQNATIAHIEAQLDQACELTGPYAAECKALVHQYLPEIIHYVEKKETPTQICTRIGVCTKNADVKHTALVALVEPTAPKAGFCGVCKAIVGFVESYLEQNSTVKQIEAKLDQACELTGAYAAECKALVAMYLPEIIHYVEKKETPTQICTRIGVCTMAAAGEHAQMLDLLVPALTLQRQLDAAPALGGAQGCLLCKTLVGYVEMYVQRNESTAAIEKKLERFCKIVKKFEMECDMLIETELSKIIAKLEQKENPTKVCDQLHICQDTPQPLQLQQLPQKPKKALVIVNEQV
jgi:saposin